MSRKFHKHRLLLDEGLFPKYILQRTNNRHNLQHIKHDINKGGISDKEIYQLAKSLKRIIVTYNIEDFRKIAKISKETGVIGVTQNLTPDQLDKKLNKLLSEHTKNYFYGKYTALSYNK